jgi:hypothetical protein
MLWAPTNLSAFLDLGANRDHHPLLFKAHSVTMNTCHIDARGSAISAVGGDQYNITNFGIHGEHRGLFCDVDVNHTDAVNRLYKPKSGETAPRSDGCVHSFRVSSRNKTPYYSKYQRMGNESYQ